jgi:hypothetical protein
MIIETIKGVGSNKGLLDYDRYEMDDKTMLLFYKQW